MVSGQYHDGAGSTNNLRLSFLNADFVSFCNAGVKFPTDAAFHSPEELVGGKAKANSSLLTICSCLKGFLLP